MTRYKIHGTITRVWEAERQVHVGGVKDSATFEVEKLGWYIEVNKLQSFFVGYEKPDLAAGQAITIVIEPRVEPQEPVEPPQPVHPIQAAGEVA